MSAEDDISLPKATLQKMIKEFMPGDVRIASEAVEMLVGCCTEFVQLLSSEANEVSTRENKSTIQPEHVIKALQELGFAEFLDEVTLAWQEHKEEAKTTNSHKAALRKTGADAAGMTEEQQIAMQQQMFAAARARSMTTVDGAAAMALTYQAQLAALQQQQSVRSAGEPEAQPAAAAEQSCQHMQQEHAAPQQLLQQQQQQQQQQYHDQHDHAVGQLSPRPQLQPQPQPQPLQAPEQAEDLVADDLEEVE